MSIKNSIFRTLKGAAIGVAIIIPGISGGTVAVLLEIYEEMIKAISSLRKEFKKKCIIFITYFNRNDYCFWYNVFSNEICTFIYTITNNFFICGTNDWLMS